MKSLLIRDHRLLYASLDARVNITYFTILNTLNTIIHNFYYIGESIPSQKLTGNSTNSFLRHNAISRTWLKNKNVIFSMRQASGAVKFYYSGRKMIFVLILTLLITLSYAFCIIT